MEGDPREDLIFAPETKRPGTTTNSVSALAFNTTVLAKSQADT
jgi:hypothetical protein